ncbi:MAG: hypothetical protein WC538_11870 [Thermoanaerobaculia bacterium]
MDQLQLAVREAVGPANSEDGLRTASRGGAVEVEPAEHVSFVVLDAMPLQEREELVAERGLPVLLLSTADVLVRRIDR